MAQHFTHLHLHTEYSLLDGAISLERLIDFGKKHQLKSLAITDHGNIFGAVKFFQMAQKAGIKPILGIESYFTEDIRIKSADNKYHHLILLVENERGYKNLCKLIAHSYEEGFYFKPRIDYALLERYSEGLIATTACLGGHIPSLLMEKKLDGANEKIEWFLKVFGPERFFLEVQPPDQQEQKVLNDTLFDLAQTRGLQTVAAGDCHFVDLEDHEAHEIMLAIQTHHKMSDPDRFSFGDCRAYMRTPQQMLEIFADHPEAVWASGAIADRCNFSFTTGKLFFPQFVVPEGFNDTAHYFQQLSRQGLEELFATGRIDATADKSLYAARLEEELALIQKMGFIGYFLVVSDFIQWAKRHNIPVGPGRGSAAGSLVAWALKITDIDPIKYNLLFERFLNPERVTMPDIDVDFCIEGRDRVIQYVRDRYGADKVCQIITFGTMMAKGVIKDVARALGIPFEDANAITDLIPDQLKITLEEALQQEPRLRELRENNPNVHKLFDIALRLEGLTRHASKHAAGVVISPEPITDVLPVYIPPKINELVTQYAMTELEALGFLKMDFLGLKNLTLIQRAIELVQKTRAITIDLAHIPLNDPATYQLIAQGKTSGVFQLESDGLKDVLVRLQPEVFEDIIAVNALYRPGPLGSGMVDDFIERRHGRQKITYLFPQLEDVLKETYGVIVYQEQVMKIASVVAGYSLGESDILRRAMGKKKADVMAEQKALFAQRAAERGYDAKKAAELFELMEYFAGYGFNKSHSAAYALIAYQTAYLKANYTAEFMACLISLESHDAEKMAFYVAEAKDLGLVMLPPDISKSSRDFSVENHEGRPGLRFGLQGIKNVGSAALDSIFAEREKKPFRDMYDVCYRVDLRTCNKRVLEQLICAGACDKLPGNRAQKFDELPMIMDRAAEDKKAHATGQMGLFGMVTTTPGEQPLYEFAQRAEWNDAVKLEKEKESLGLYLSAQPFDQFKALMKWLGTTEFATAKKQGGTVLCLGTITSHKTITTKKGERMAFVGCEDGSGKAELIIFPKLYARISPWLDAYTTFIIKGVVDTASNQTCKIKADECIPVDLFFAEWPTDYTVRMGLSSAMDEVRVAQLKKMLTEGQTQLEIVFSEKGKKLALRAKQGIHVDRNTLTQLDAAGMTISIGNLLPA